MRKLFLKAFGCLTLLAWSGLVSAVGFGGINVTSSLGQPLVAEIELVAVEKADKASLNARLASPEAFKGAGIDYPYTLPKLKFQLETRANGEPFLKVSSDQPVNEPFVSVLIELGWSSGRLLREYTFLLDPPGFVAEQPAAVTVKPIEPVAAVAPAPVVVAPAPVEPVMQAASAPVAASAPAAVAKMPVEKLKTVPAPLKQKTESSVASVTVKRGDTLSKIATQTKSSDVSLERMLVALYRANAEAFDGSNMNRLRTGKILHMPETNDLAKLQQAEAVNEIHAQVADWNVYRQKLAGATASAVEHRSKQEVAGKISTTVAEKAPASKESAKEVLKLSKGDAPSDKAGAGGKAKSAQDKAAAKEEEAVAKVKALKEAEQRTALLEKNIKDMQRLAELKTQAAASKVAQTNATPVAASAVATVASSAVVAPASAAASAVAIAAPKVKPVAPKVVTPSPSMLDEVLSNPIYLGGGAAVLLGLGGLGYMRTRKSKQAETKSEPAEAEDMGSTTGRIAAPVMPSPETGDFTNAAVTSVPSSSDSEEVDPIGEADLFLNFGRDVQAEEVLKEALHKNPENNAVKLKLLSIYATRKDTKSFYVYALEIKDSGDEPAWEKAAAMGRELEPGNETYGGEGGAASEPIVTDASLPAVDFDLGFGAAEVAPLAVSMAGVEKAMVQDVPATEKTVIMSASELRAAQEAPMDFDVTGTHPGVKAVTTEEAQFDVPAMDFDVTGTHPGLKPVTSVEPALDLSAMDFDLTDAHSIAKSAVVEEVKLDTPAMDFDVTGAGTTAPVSPANVEAEQPPLNLDDLVFDITSSHPAVSPSTANSPAASSAVDAGMAFTIDLPIEKSSEVVAPAKDINLSEISFNLDDLAAPVSSLSGDVKSEQWQEVATKLDLAKAYQEMGDQAGAREILEEVVREGDDAQRQAAESLMQQLL